MPPWPSCWRNTPAPTASTCASWPAIAHEEKLRNKPPRAFRELFRELRLLLADNGAGGNHDEAGFDETGDETGFDPDHA